MATVYIKAGVYSASAIPLLASGVTYLVGDIVRADNRFFRCASGGLTYGSAVTNIHLYYAGTIIYGDAFFV